VHFLSNGNGSIHYNIFLLLDFCTFQLYYVFSGTDCVQKVGTASTQHHRWCQSGSVSMILSLETHNCM